MNNLSKLLMTGLLLFIFMSGCHDDAEIVLFQNDFFCEEGKPDVFLKVQLDGGDILIAADKNFDIDLCNINRQLFTTTSKASNEAGYHTALFNTKVVTNGFELSLGINGIYQEEELDLTDDRDYAEKVLANDFLFRVGSLTATERYVDEFGQYSFPNGKSSLFSFTIAVEEGEGFINYSTTDPSVLANYAGCCEGFQEDSFFNITSVEAIDYQNPDFPETTYNYIIAGEFRSLIYRQDNLTKEKAIRVSNGSFRMPFNVPTTSSLFAP
ncbi:MAG: hypothetical protein WBA74_21025 [Cyclobacteriaceae bacterium]